MIALTLNRIPWAQLTQSLHGAHLYQLKIGRELKVAHLVVMSSADPAQKYAVLVRPISRHDVDLNIRQWVLGVLSADYGPKVNFGPLHVAEEGHLFTIRDEARWLGVKCGTGHPSGRIFVTSYDVAQELWSC